MLNIDVLDQVEQLEKVGKLSPEAKELVKYAFESGYNLSEQESVAKDVDDIEFKLSIEGADRFEAVRVVSRKEIESAPDKASLFADIIKQLVGESSAKLTNVNIERKIL